MIGPPGYFLAEASPALHAHVEALADLRMVFFAGLPGTGKSLFVHQLAHLAQSKGRRVHLLQWDISRPVFEASSAGRRYPVIDGVTHVLIRRAVGLWARGAVADWCRTHDASRDLLLGETPLIGRRLIELTQPVPDEAEGLLTAPSCAFALPVPSIAVRRHIESERERRSTSPSHERELEDAPPSVMQLSWRELVQESRVLGLAASTTDDGIEYDASLYRAYYEHLLATRNQRVIEVDELLPTSEMSVYDYTIPPTPVLPAEDEAERWIREAEAGS